MGYREEDRRKLVPAAEAAGLVRSGMKTDYGAVSGFPILIDEELALLTAELKDVIVRAYSSPREPQIVKADPRQEHFIYHSGHFSRFDRKNHELGRCAYIPSQMGDMPRLYREVYRDESDIAFIEASPMDERGFFNFGAGVSFQKAICDVAKTVVIEVNPSQPRVYGGYDEIISIDDVDYIVENDKYPIDEVATPPPTEADRQIARHVADLIENEATIEFGIGVIPNLVGGLLIERGVKDLGIHTGTLTDSMVDLIEAGVVTGAKKSINAGKAVSTMALGSRRLYKFMEQNPALASFPSDYTHSVQVIARNSKQIAVNGALKMDLTGQVCSDAVGYKQISGTGGQLEFNRGADLSNGGKAVICLAATHAEKGKLVSNIVAGLDPGDTVTVPATEVSYVVTEFGVVNLKGKSAWQRARLLISIAHPDFRDELEEAARKVNLITRGEARLKV